MTTIGPIISYPIPAYQNVPIRADYYMPSQFFIEDIQLGLQTLITATTPMNYTIGQEIRLNIPSSFGCYQLNQKTGFVIALPQSDQVLVDIDSSVNVDPYVASSAPTQAQIVPIGDVNSGPVNNQGRTNNITFIEGSFINISPQ